MVFDQRFKTVCFCDGSRPRIQKRVFCSVFGAAQKPQFWVLKAEAGKRAAPPQKDGGEGKRGMQHQLKEGWERSTTKWKVLPSLAVLSQKLMMQNFQLAVNPHVF